MRTIHFTSKIRQYLLILSLCMSTSLFAQTIPLTGTVTDTKGETLIVPVFWTKEQLMVVLQTLMVTSP